MKKTVKYMTVTTAAAVMLVGSISVSYAADVKCPNCGYLLTGNVATNRPGTPSSPATPNTPATNVPAVKKGWVETTVDRETVWNYYDNNGNMIKNQWFQSPSSGLWYYFDRDGVMVTGWGEESAVDGYWFDSSGAMATGWREIPLEEERTYGPSAGTGDKGYFYFGGNGKVCEGWNRIGDKWYYLNDGYVDGFSDYQMVYGEVEIDGDQYYFGESNDGSMKTGRVKVISETNPGSPSSQSTESYYLYNDGGVRVEEGWGKYNNVWYYIHDGIIVTNSFLALDSSDNVEEDIEDAASVYYMDKDGVMKTGWIEVSSENQSGPNMTKGKICYFFNSNGRMATGWKKDGNKWYYLNPSKKTTNSPVSNRPSGSQSPANFEIGQMVTGLYTVESEGKTYFFNSNGEMVTSTWKEVDGDDIYLGSDGVMYQAKASDDLLIKEIRNRYYIFNENGKCLEGKGTVVIDVGGKWQVTQADISTLKDGTVYYEIGNSNIASRKVKK